MTEKAKKIKEKIETGKKLNTNLDFTVDPVLAANYHKKFIEQFPFLELKPIGEDIEKLKKEKLEYGYDKPSKFEPIDDKKHLKGYIYDSLVYRYKFALEMATEARAYTLRSTSHQGRSRDECIAAAHKQNEKDVIRFCEILNEAIGEHD